MSTILAFSQRRVIVFINFVTNFRSSRFRITVRNFDESFDQKTSCTHKKQKIIEQRNVSINYMRTGNRQYEQVQVPLTLKFLNGIR